MRRRQTNAPQWKSRYVIDREQAFRLSKHQGTMGEVEDEHSSSNQRLCILNHLNPKRMRWDYLVMFLATVNCFMVPVELAVQLEWLKATWYQVVNIVVDLIFILDIVVNFSTTFEEGYEVIYDRKRIAEQYIRSRFIIDFLSGIPIDLVLSIFMIDGLENAKEVKAVSLLKLVRMLRISRIIRALNVQKDLKSKIKLVKVFFQLILYLHCQACLIWFVIIEDKIWNDPFLSRDPAVGRKFYSDSELAQYLTSFYLSLLSLHGPDIYLRTLMGQVVGVFTIWFGLMVQGNLLGTFAEIVYEINEKDILSQAHADASVAAMTQVDLDLETKNVSINYVKVVAMELYQQESFEIFLRQVSPNLINRVNRNLLELLVSLRLKDGIFRDVAGTEQQDVILKEVLEISKLLVLQERSSQSIIMEEGDVCDGLYIIQKGTTQASIMNRDGKTLRTAEFERSAMIGEISFFLQSKRTAKVYCISNVRLFFLDVRYKKTLLELCPRLFRRMRHNIYKYTDDVLEYKIKLLQESVYYFREAEREALVEIAFQMQIKSHPKDMIVVNQMQDIEDIYIVYEGLLSAQLPTQNYGISYDKFLFEKFPPGSSYGLYSILKLKSSAADADAPPPTAKSRFKVVTNCYSWVIKINASLLFNVVSKFSRLERLIKTSIKYVDSKGIPLCDFQINDEAITKFKRRVREKLRMLKREKEHHVLLQSLKRSNRFVRIFKDFNSQDANDDDIDQNSSIEVGNQMMHEAQFSVQAPSFSQFGSSNQSLLVNSDLSLNDSSVSSSPANSVLLRIVRQERSQKRKRYQNALVRAVRRQILINVHRRNLLKNFKVTNAMVLSADSNMEMNEVDTNKIAQASRNTKLSYLFEDMILARVNDYIIGDDIEGISVIVYNNLKRVQQMWTSIKRPLEDAHKLRVAIYGQFDKFLKEARVDNPYKINLKRRTELIKKRIEKDEEMDRELKQIKVFCNIKSTPYFQDYI